MSEREDNDRPDSGVFPVEKAIIEEGGRRASDKIWGAFLAEDGPWRTFRAQFKRHTEDGRAQIEDIHQRIDSLMDSQNQTAVRIATLDANQKAVLTFIWGSEEDRRAHKTAGLAKTKEDADRILRWVLCPTWRLLARAMLGVLAAVGTIAITLWAQGLFQ
ncbi:MAG TPA: hypothetical protein VF104_10410 [Burkholderiales bacterium]